MVACWLTFLIELRIVYTSLEEHVKSLWQAPSLRREKYKNNSMVTAWINEWVTHALLHVQALAPVGKGLLSRFPSRCCPSGTKGPPFSPGSGIWGYSHPFNTGWLYQPVLKGPAWAATLQDRGIFFVSFLRFCLLFIYNNNRFVNLGTSQCQKVDGCLGVEFNRFLVANLLLFLHELWSGSSKFVN